MKTYNHLLNVAIEELTNHTLILRKLAISSNQPNHYSSFTTYASNVELAITLLQHECDPSVIIPTDNINITSVLLPIKSILSTYDRSINKARTTCLASIEHIKEIKESLEYATTVIESYS